MANKWTFENIDLELAVAWAISRSTTHVKKNIIVNYGNFQSEISPNSHYGETPAKLLEEIDLIQSLDVTTLDRWDEVSDQFTSSFAFGIESCLVQAQAAAEDKTLYEYLEIDPPAQYTATSFSIPIMEPEKIQNYVQKVSRFPVLKLKINRDNATILTEQTLKHFSKKIRIDGNECFRNIEEFMNFADQFPAERVEFMEQPFAADNHQAYLALREQNPYPIIADESVLKIVDWNLIQQQFDGVNVKLMKAAGLRTAVSQLKKAKELGLQTMIGCMIETSIGIAHALRLTSLADYVDLDGHLLIGQDPFQQIEERDGMLKLNV